MSDFISYIFIASTCTRKVPGSLESIEKIIKESPLHEPVHVNEHCPNDVKRRYQFLEALKGGLSIPVVHLIYKSGNNVGGLHYIWNSDPSEKDTIVFERSLHVVENLRPIFAKFSTQAMDKSMLPSLAGSPQKLSHLFYFTTIGN